MTAKKMIGKVSYKENLAGETWLLGIELEEKTEFIPGQFVSIKVNEEGLRRSYSVASLPGKKRIELVVDVAPMGSGSKYVLSLKVGDEVEVLGFLGRFSVSDELLSKRSLVFVGTGTGVVPLKVMIEDLLKGKEYKGQVTLVWGMRFESDLYWQNEIDKLQREYDNFHLEISLSRPTEKWPGVSGHVGDVIDKMTIENDDMAVFLCGNPEMITEIREKFITKGVLEEHILHERFA